MTDSCGTARKPIRADARNVLSRFRWALHRRNARRRTRKTLINWCQQSRSNVVNSAQAANGEHFRCQGVDVVDFLPCGCHSGCGLSTGGGDGDGVVKGRSFVGGGQGRI